MHLRESQNPISAHVSGRSPQGLQGLDCVKLRLTGPNSLELQGFLAPTIRAPNATAAVRAACGKTPRLQLVGAMGSSGLSAPAGVGSYSRARDCPTH